MSCRRNDGQGRKRHGHKERGRVPGTRDDGPENGRPRRLPEHQRRRHQQGADAALERIDTLVRQGDAVLVKGSRVAALERVAEKLG